MRIVLWVSALAAVVAGVALFVLRPAPDTAADGAGPRPNASSTRATSSIELERDPTGATTAQERSDADPSGAARVPAAKPEAAPVPTILATALPVDANMAPGGSGASGATGGGSKGGGDLAQKYAGMSQEQIRRAFDDLDAVIQDPSSGERFGSDAMSELKREYEYVMTLRDNN